MAEEYKRPGWYPSPDGAPGERWWNGSSWSDSRRGGPAVAPPAPLPPVPTVVYGANSPAPQRPDPYAPAVPAAAPRTALSISVGQNRVALIALILGVIGVFGFYIASPAAVVLGAIGISKARQLKAQGAAGASLVPSAIGVVTGLIGTILLVVTVIGFIAAFTIDYTP